jgi:hypothetical protein
VSDALFSCRHVVHGQCHDKFVDMAPRYGAEGAAGAIGTEDPDTGRVTATITAPGSLPD